jgi:hypothetical protein
MLNGSSIWTRPGPGPELPPGRRPDPRPPPRPGGGPERQPPASHRTLGEPVGHRPSTVSCWTGDPPDGG